MKIELIRISLSSIPELTYNIEVLQGRRNMRKITYTGDLDSWWNKVTMNPVSKRGIIRFLNKVAMTEERWYI